MYPYKGLRHSLWVMSFVFPIIAWIIADLYKLFKIEKYIGQRAFACILMIAGILSYNQSVRFEDSEEYTTTQNEWQRISNYLRNIDDQSVLIVERSEATLLGNAYELYGNGWPHDIQLSKTMPYNNTKVIFTPYHYGYDEKYIFIKNMNLAKDNELFGNAENLIFMMTSSTGFLLANAQIPAIALCSKLSKKIDAFPPLKDDEPLTRENIYSHTALFITVSKKDFFEQVISPTGKANDCLDKKIW